MTSMKILVALSTLFPFSFGFVPLVDKHFPYAALPEKVDTSVDLPRGPQTGYNRCNSSTEGPHSLCQTAIINSLDDFCLWAPPTPGKTVGEIEGQMVAWCSKPGHGTRVMPPGTLTGVQLTHTPDYIQVVGFMDQTKIDMVKGDSGGEMDPHGADQRGNPIGGVVYTQAFADNGTYIQAIQWHNFNGNNIFCFKACDPSSPHAAQLCQHIFDTEGCSFNAPSNARNGVFESCAGDSQAPPGSPNGTVVPKSSQCSTFASTAIYGGGKTVRVPGATFVPTATATGTSAKFTGSGTNSESGAGPSQTHSSTGVKIIRGRFAYAFSIASALGLATLL